jgi:hypothetical protein
MENTMNMENMMMEKMRMKKVILHVNVPDLT